MFADPEVRAIVCTIGGYNANQLLELLDYELIAANPKLFVGYSDITGCTARFTRAPGSRRCLAPRFCRSSASSAAWTTATWGRVRAVVDERRAGRAALQPEHWYPGRRLWWTSNDRGRIPEPAAPWRTVRAGRAEGPIVAGNVNTLLLLNGTPWEPPLDGALLCLEDDEDYGKPWMVERQLFQLRQLGAFDRAAGLAYGRIHPEAGFESEAGIDEILLRATAGTETSGRGGARLLAHRSAPHAAVGRARAPGRRRRGDARAAGGGGYRLDLKGIAPRGRMVRRSSSSFAAGLRPVRARARGPVCAASAAAGATRRTA